MLLITITVHFNYRTEFFEISDIQLLNSLRYIIL